MDGVLAQPWAVLLQLQLLATWFAAERVVVVAGLFTDQENHFGFSFGHLGRLSRDVVWRWIGLGARGVGEKFSLIPPPSDGPLSSSSCGFSSAFCQSERLPPAPPIAA